MNAEQQGRNEESRPKTIYKKYKQPDGTVLGLTRGEFDKVVDLFRRLLIQDEKNKKASQQQFETLSHQAFEETGNTQILEPK